MNQCEPVQSALYISGTRSSKCYTNEPNRLHWAFLIIWFLLIFYKVMLFFWFLLGCLEILSKNLEWSMWTCKFALSELRHLIRYRWNWFNIWFNWFKVTPPCKLKLKEQVNFCKLSMKHKSSIFPFTSVQLMCDQSVQGFQGCQNDYFWVNGKKRGRGDNQNFYFL